MYCRSLVSIRRFIVLFRFYRAGFIFELFLLIRADRHSFTVNSNLIINLGFKVVNLSKIRIDTISTWTPSNIYCICAWSVNIVKSWIKVFNSTNAIHTLTNCRPCHFLPINAHKELNDILSKCNTRK